MRSWGERQQHYRAWGRRVALAAAMGLGLVACGTVLFVLSTVWARPRQPSTAAISEDARTPPAARSHAFPPADTAAGWSAPHPPGGAGYYSVVRPWSSAAAAAALLHANPPNLYGNVNPVVESGVGPRLTPGGIQGHAGVPAVGGLRAH